jgi:hypothetical protein
LPVFFPPAVHVPEMAIQCGQEKHATRDEREEARIIIIIIAGSKKKRSLMWLHNRYCIHPTGGSTKEIKE